MGGIPESGPQAAYTVPESREDKEWRQSAKEEWAGDSLEGRSHSRKTSGVVNQTPAFRGELGRSRDAAAWFCLTNRRPQEGCGSRRGLAGASLELGNTASQPVATGTSSSDPAISDEAEGATFTPEARESTPEMAQNSTPSNQNVPSGC